MKFRNCSVFKDICTCLDTNKFSYDFSDGLLWSIDYTGGVNIGVSPRTEERMHFIGDFDEIEFKFRGDGYVEIRAFRHSENITMYKMLHIDRCCNGLTSEAFKNFIYQELEITLIGF